MQMIFLKLESCFNCRDVTSVNTDFLFCFGGITAPLFFFVLEVSQHCDKRPKAHFLFVLPVCIYDLNTVVQAATRKGSATTHNFFFSSLQNGAFFSCMSIWTAQVENVMLCTNVVKKGRSESLFCLYICLNSHRSVSAASHHVLACHVYARYLFFLTFVTLCKVFNSLVTYRDGSTHNPKSIVKRYQWQRFLCGKLNSSVSFLRLWQTLFWAASRRSY